MKLKSTILLTALASLVCHSYGMKAYKSTRPLTDKDAVAGIQLVSDSIKKSSNFSDGITICGAFNYRHLDIWHSVMMDIHTNNALVVHLSMGYEKTILLFADYKTIVQDLHKDTFQIWTPQIWHHICLSYDAKISRFCMVKDGFLTNVDVTLESDASFLSAELPQSVFFGRKQVNEKGHSLHSGMISNINIWDRALAPSQLRNWTSCQSEGIEGNIVDWSSSKWTVTNMSEEETDVCKTSTSQLVLVPQLSAEAAVEFCWKLRGELFLLQNQASYDLAKGMTNERLWTGWWDKPIENKFTDMLGKGLELNLTEYKGKLWLKYEPNGYGLENCIAASKYGFYDKTCGDEIWSLCTIKESPIFRLRGLCDKVGFDKDFAWTGELKNGRFTFRGFSKSFLSFDSGIWRLVHIGNSELFATSDGREKYPLGTNLWHFHEDICGGSKEHVLSLSSCSADSFNCDDGTCVDIQKRCDGTMDCSDRSDEFNCHKIKAEKEIDFKDLPPPAKPPNRLGLGKAKETLEKLKVKCHIEIFNILDIDEVSAKITLQFKVRVEWIEPRVDFRDLKEDENVNIISQKEKDELWMPSLVFINTKSKQEISFRNVTSSAYIRINEGAHKIENPMHEIHNGFRHEGKDCTLVAMDSFAVDFIYNFEMHWYPFDSQRFHAILAPPKDEQLFVQLVPGDITYFGPSDLMKYAIKGYRLKQSGDNQTLAIEIVLGRQILSEVLTTILPTIIIMLVSFSTSYYGPGHFDANVTVNLTALLVMVTLFISVFTGLPRTSAIKMIDVWFIFTLFIPFIEAVVQTKIEVTNAQLKSMEEQEVMHLIPIKKKELETEMTRKRKTLKQLEFFASYGLFCLTFFFLATFFMIGFLVAN